MAWHVRLMPNARPAVTLLKRLAGALLPVLALLLFAGYFLHLEADMPDAARWNDYARFTDEGWYAGAALHHALDGRWYQPHSFNPAVALPAWPALLSVVFHVTGPTMAAARGTALVLFGIALLTLFLLLRPRCGSAIAGGAIVLTLLNPYTYNFARMAMLEPALVCLMMLGLAVALRASRWRNRPAALTAAGIALGTLMCCTVLVKTPGLVLLPPMLVAAWAVLRKAGASRQRALLLPATAAVTAGFLWLAWFSPTVCPHLLADYHHLFAINAEPTHTLRAVLTAEAKALYDLFWLGRLFFPLLLLALVASLGPLRRVWQQPLFVALVLELGLYVAFLGWHANRQQRYEVVCLLPTAGIVALALAELRQQTGRRPIFLGASALAAFTACLFAATTLPEVLHPRYTWRDAARAVAATIGADKAKRPVLLAGPGDDIALFTGLATSNPRWPPGGLAPLLRACEPGWYLAPVPTDDDTIDQLRRFYRLREAGTYVAMPTFSHRALVLYRLEPLLSSEDTEAVRR